MTGCREDIVSCGGQGGLFGEVTSDLKEKDSAV